MSIANVGLTTNTRARVTLTLEITLLDNWNGEAQINQIVGQAKDSARGALASVLRSGQARIIGEPTVTVVMVDGRE